MKNGWIQKQQRLAVERREITQRRTKSVLWTASALVIVIGVMAGLMLNSKPGYGIFAAAGLVCFAVAARARTQRSVWTIYGRQGLALPFACMLAGWIFGTPDQFVIAAVIGFVIYGAANVLRRMRQTASA